MLDKAFKNSRAVFGVPVAILLVVLLAIGTGGAAYAAYLGLSSHVQTTVSEPLAYERIGGEWQDETFVCQIMACETKTAQILVTNSASVDVPIYAVVTVVGESWDGITCVVTDNATAQDLVASRGFVLASGGTMTIDVTVSADCGVSLPGGDVTVSWDVNLFRG